MSEKKKKLLEQLYTEPKFGVAYSNWTKIWKKAKKIDKTITKEDVQLFLRNKKSHSLYAKKFYNFPKRKMYSLSPKVQVAIDLMELSQSDKRINFPFKFLFCQIDICSRYLQVIPLKKKDVENIKFALLSTFQIYKPKSILCDKESSFYSKEIVSFLKSEDVQLFSQKSAPTLKWKNGMVERAQRTLRMLITKYCEENNIKRFIKHLKLIVEIFNSRVNRSTGFSPNQLHFDKDAMATYQEKLLKQLSQDKKQKSSSSPSSSLDELKLGDYVRFRVLYNSFAKEVDKTYSRSIHTIVAIRKTKPLIYRIYPTPKNQDRYFYRQELFKVDKLEKFDIPIEKIVSVKKLPNGEKLYECLLLGYEKTEWLTQTSLKSRFILFPLSLSEETTTTKNINEEKMLTRYGKKKKNDNLETKMITRSQMK